MRTKWYRRKVQYIALLSGLLVLLLTGLVIGSAFDDFKERPAWWQDREPVNPNPPVSGPTGWPGYAPDNSPPPEQPPAAPEAGDEVVVVTGLALTSTNASLAAGTFETIFTCEGSDESPPLSWSLTTAVIPEDEVPEDAVKPSDIESYLLTMVDESGVALWVAYNIGSNQLSVSQAVPNVVFFNGFYQGKNDKLKTGYSGPCPPDTDQHSYTFSLDALDSQLSFATPEDVTYADVAAAVQGVGVLFSSTLSAVYTKGTGGEPVTEFELRSNDFANNGNIPLQFTCDGNDISPQLEWEGAPAGTLSFALLVNDLDNTPPAEGFSHWVVNDLPARRTGINGGVPEGANPGGADIFQGMNGLGNLRYNGPCPPAYDGAHRYQFELFALDAELNLGGGLTDAAVRGAIAGNTLDSAVLLGNYERAEGGGSGTLTLASPDFVDGGTLPANSQSDFDTSTGGIQCLRAPVDADTFVTCTVTAGNVCPTVPQVAAACCDGGNVFECPGGVYPCGAGQLGDSGVACVAQPVCPSADIPDVAGSCCLGTVGFPGFVYRCPNAAASCDLESAIPVVDFRGRMNNVDPGLSPALEWDDIPDGTVTLAVVATDGDLVGSLPDGGSANLTAHWVVYNIPPTVRTLASSIPKNFFTDGYIFQALNDIWWIDTARTADDPLGDGVLDERVDVGYWGGCTTGNRIVYTLIALDSELSFANVEDVTYLHVVNAMRGHIIGTSELQGVVP